MLYPEQKLRTELGGACFEIADINQFACQIGNELGGCTQIWAGPCVYEEARIVNTEGMDLPLDKFRDDKDPSKNSLDKVLQAANELQGPRQFFLKEKRFQHQCEYRFIWHMSRPTRDFIDISLPNPPSYCRKV